uniref:Uncharacterized protein n=1 Tax=Aegilops tauschii subsp. strangulata TaxID=200361 RepID=A0A452YHQ8_AEGTS
AFFPNRSRRTARRFLIDLFVYRDFYFLFFLLFWRVMIFTCRGNYFSSRLTLPLKILYVLNPALWHDSYNFCVPTVVL